MMGGGVPSPQKDTPTPLTSSAVEAMLAKAAPPGSSSGPSSPTSCLRPWKRSSSVDRSPPNHRGRGLGAGGPHPPAGITHQEGAEEEEEEGEGQHPCYRRAQAAEQQVGLPGVGGLLGETPQNGEEEDEEGAAAVPAAMS